MNSELTKLKNRLVTSDSSFKYLRLKNAVYVDKTEYIYRIVGEGLDKAYFLSRPRRFGKSLLLNTIGKLFEAKKELFRGLYIYDKWDWNQAFPVIRLDLSCVEESHKNSNREILVDKLRHEIISSAKELDIALHPNNEPDILFSDFIREAYHRAKKTPVVVLIDEYDIPIVSNILSPEKAKAAKILMHSFYKVLKKNNEYIRFLMLTGISKFSGISVFSALNNLVDISLNPKYSAICGYTEAELDKYFTPFMEVVNRERFREMYNGYNWLGEAVYNPIDVMKAIDWAVTKKSPNQFKSFWFDTGTPSFLADIMKEKGVLIPNLGPDGMSGNVFSELKITHLSVEALLFQTGYLTIAEEIVDKDGYDVKYRLKYPNREVQLAISDYFLQYILVPEECEDPKHQAPMAYPRDELNKVLLEADFHYLFRIIHSFFASLSHNWYRNNKIASSEGFYCTVIFTMFAAVCNVIEPESQTNKGQIDLFVVKGDKRYLFEVKVRENAHGNGLDQIIKKGYAEKYENGENLYLVGIEFSAKERNIVQLEYCIGKDGERTVIHSGDKT